MAMAPWEIVEVMVERDKALEECNALRAERDALRAALGEECLRVAYATLEAENAALRAALQHVTAAGVRFLPDGCPTCRTAQQLAEESCDD
jgi:regulator of replication initiation timing